MSVLSEPVFQLPESSSTVTVRVIDSTTRLYYPVGTQLQPNYKGHTDWANPSYSFLVEHGQQTQHQHGSDHHEKTNKARRVLFDLGVQKDWQNQAPSIVDMIKDFGWTIKVEKHVAEILEENGVEKESIEAIIWSHWHWDHLGNPSTFPHSTDVIVGPGFKDAFLPGGKPIDDSPIKEEYYQDRKLREIEPHEFTLNIAGFPAYDYFGDGSFYLLDSPGHAVGHLCGLARTTSSTGPGGGGDRDTFVLMGGDIASHCGEFRPSKYHPLPAMISPNPLFPPSEQNHDPCPGHLFEKINRDGRNDIPFYCFGTWPDGEAAAEDEPAAMESVRKLQVLDAPMNYILVILAHDEHISEVIDLFPKDINQWQQKGWGGKSRWLFLGDFKLAIEYS